ncbi:MAG: resolvase [Rhizobiales bacterium NRL2]|jgi:DNA invertase Pin-like site-specific DNA recombinase|nr:MAG: resolvase [Rhizobiales bacterium NRL2]
MKTCFAYVRVSTARQGEGVSLDAQRDAIEAFAERNGITVTRWFEEKETAAKSGRPVFRQLLKLLKARKAEGLVIHKIDRSARNFADWAKIGELSDAGIDIHFATESLDFRSRGGRLTADIQAVIAADYIRNLREETRKGIRGRLKQGLYPFGAPIGYLNNGGGKPKTLDPERAPLVRETFELYASGEYSLHALRAETERRGLRNRGGKPISKLCLEKMLDNPFYCGLCRLRRTGETYEGIHQPLISISLFERVQAVRADRGKKKSTRHDHRYRGLFQCGSCGRCMVAERQKAHVYYRCHTRLCTTPMIREDRLERAIMSTLCHLAPSDASVDALLGAIETLRDEKQYAQRTAGFDMQLQRLEERLRRLTDALIDQLIEKQDFETRKRALLEEKRHICELRARVVDGDRVLDEIANMVRTAQNLAKSFEHADRKECRELIRIAFSNRTVSAKEVELKPSNWLKAVDDAAYGIVGGPDRLTSRTLIQELLEILLVEMPWPCGTSV